MWEPQLYEKSKLMQMDIVNYFLDKYFYLVKLRPECDDKILDVGSGDGGTTVDILFKRFTGKRATIVGCDKSLEMLNFSREKYKNYENVTFRELDIETKTLPVDMTEKFDHIFTFFCLFWTTDLEQAVKNIYDLLKPNGDLFAITPTEQGFLHPFLDISLGNSKWAKYLKEPRRYMPQYVFYDNLEDDFNKLFVKCGFKVVICKNFYKEYTYNSMDEFIQTVDALNPFKRNIPPRELADFYEYYVSFVKKETNWLNILDDGKITYKFYDLFIYATK